jgi:iron complex transport system ATP-binding protein
MTGGSAIESAAQIVATGLGVRLAGRPIVVDASFEVPRGAWCALVGPNGSGKTTLLRAIAGLLPYAGELILDGRQVHSWRAQDLARQLAFVRQSAVFSFDLSVGDLVLLGRSPHKRLLEPWKEQDRVLVREAIEKVGLAGMEKRSIMSLSGGERQRALLAQAMVQATPVLLLDEPTNHLDVYHQFEFLERVALLVSGGKTVVSAFHDLSLALRHADYLLVMHAGRLVAHGRPAEVLTPDLIRDVFRMTARVSGKTIEYIQTFAR